MPRAWKAYRTDLQRVYPLLSTYSIQVNEVSTTNTVESLLPSSFFRDVVNVSNICQFAELIPRNIVLWDDQGAQFRVNCPFPFSMALHDFLSAKTNVAAFQFIGEQMKYGRLKRLLENV